MDWQIFFSTFVAIFLAEMGDKTQFAAMAAGASSDSKLTILIAVVLALSAAGALGVLAGSFLSQYTNPKVMSSVSGVVFIGIGLWMLFGKS